MCNILCSLVCYIFKQEQFVPHHDQWQNQEHPPQSPVFNQPPMYSQPPLFQHPPHQQMHGNPPPLMSQPPPPIIPQGPPGPRMPGQAFHSSQMGPPMSPVPPMQEHHMQRQVKLPLEVFLRSNM